MCNMHLGLSSSSDPYIFNTDGCTTVCYIKITPAETQKCTHNRNFLKLNPNIPQIIPQTTQFKKLFEMYFKFCLFLVLFAFLSFVRAEKGLHSTMCTMFCACFTPCGGRIMTDRTSDTPAAISTGNLRKHNRFLSLKDTHIDTSSLCLAILLNA